MTEMARWLRAAGVDRTQGFATNVSNFYRVDTERAYADRLADAIGGDPHFVIDVSRNGQAGAAPGATPRAGLGQAPHVTAGSTPARRPALGEDARAQRRHLQRRTGGRAVVGVVRPGAGGAPQRD